MRIEQHPRMSPLFAAMGLRLQVGATEQGNERQFEVYPTT
jgi:hypothetical protein